MLWSHWKSRKDLYVLFLCWILLHVKRLTSLSLFVKAVWKSLQDMHWRHFIIKKCQFLNQTKMTNWFYVCLVSPKGKIIIPQIGKQIQIKYDFVLFWKTKNTAPQTTNNNTPQPFPLFAIPQQINIPLGFEVKPSWFMHLMHQWIRVRLQSGIIIISSDSLVLACVSLLFLPRLKQTSINCGIFPKTDSCLHYLCLIQKFLNSRWY